MGGEQSLAELRRKERIDHNIFYRWSKGCRVADKARHGGDVKTEASSDEVQDFSAEAGWPKEALAAVTF
jgi:transposase